MPVVMDNQNPFAGKNKPEDKLACYWYNTLYGKVMSLYDWKGKPFEGNNASLNRDYLEWVLITMGQAGFMKDKEGKLRGLMITRTGLDPYGFPISLTATNPVLGNLNGVVGIDAVWVRNNKFAVPAISTIEYYARQLAKIQTSLNVSLTNNRMTKVFSAENDAQAQQIRRLVDDIDAGKLAVITKPDLLDNLMGGDKGGIPVYSTPSEYLADKYIQDMRSVLNDFYVAFGVNASGANIIKHERNLVDEVNSNNQEILINRAYWLDPRKEAAKLASELFDTEITCDIKIPEEGGMGYELREFSNE